MTRLINVYQLHLNGEENRVAKLALKHFGKADGPFPDDSNLPFFTAKHLGECLKKAVKHLTEFIGQKDEADDDHRALSNDLFLVRGVLKKIHDHEGTGRAPTSSGVGKS